MSKETIKSKYIYRVMSMTDLNTLEVKGWSVFRRLRGSGNSWQGIIHNGLALFETEAAARAAKREVESL